MGGGPSKDVLTMRSRDWPGDGQVAIVTGPTGTGIGLHSARWLAERGAHVILAGRSPERLAACEKEIRATATNADGTKNESLQLTSIELDLGSLKSIERFADAYHKLNLPQLNILLNNAGIMGTPYKQTEDGFEIQFGTNHIGHHYLTQLLLPDLKRGAPSRIVNVSSRGHVLAAKLTPDNLDLAFRPTEKEYGPWSSYGNSKLGNVLEARSLNAKYSADGITAYSLHPGVVATELGRQGKLSHFFYTAFGWAMKTSEEGSGTSIFCATSPDALKDAGKFFDVCTVSTKTSRLGLDDNLAEALWQKTELEIAEWKKKQAAGAGSSAAAAEQKE